MKVTDSSTNPKNTPLVAVQGFGLFFLFLFASTRLTSIVKYSLRRWGPEGCVLLVATTPTSILSPSQSFVARPHRVLPVLLQLGHYFCFRLFFGFSLAASSPLVTS